jgi:hypothetical protein
LAHRRDALVGQESASRLGDLIRSGIELKVAGVQDMSLSLGCIPPISFGF